MSHVEDRFECAWLRHVCSCCLRKCNIGCVKRGYSCLPHRIGFESQDDTCIMEYGLELWSESNHLLWTLIQNVIECLMGSTETLIGTMMQHVCM